MRTLYGFLHSILKVIFVLELVLINVRSYLVQSCYEVEGDLLVFGRRVFDVGEGALTLHSVFVVLKKLKGCGLVEGNARETVINEAGGEGLDCVRTIISLASLRLRI